MGGGWPIARQGNRHATATALSSPLPTKPAKGSTSEQVRRLSHPAVEIAGLGKSFTRGRRALEIDGLKVAHRQHACGNLR